MKPINLNPINTGLLRGSLSKWRGKKFKMVTIFDDVINNGNCRPQNDVFRNCYEILVAKNTTFLIFS